MILTYNAWQDVLWENSGRLLRSQRRNSFSCTLNIVVSMWYLVLQSHLVILRKVRVQGCKPTC